MENKRTPIHAMTLTGLIMAVFGDWLSSLSALATSCLLIFAFGQCASVAHHFEFETTAHVLRTLQSLTTVVAWMIAFASTLALARVGRVIHSTGDGIVHTTAQLYGNDKDLKKWQERIDAFKRHRESMAQESREDDQENPRGED